MEEFTTFKEIWDECDGLSQTDKDEILSEVDFIGEIIETRENKGLTQ